MKCQNLSGEKIKKNISVFSAENLPRVLSIKSQFYVYFSLKHLLWNGIIFYNMS